MPDTPWGPHRWRLVRKTPLGWGPPRVDGPEKVVGILCRRCGRFVPLFPGSGKCVCGWSYRLCVQERLKEES